MHGTMEVSTNKGGADRDSDNIKTKVSDLGEDITNRGQKGFSWIAHTEAT